MPEEAASSPGPNEDAIRRLERRLETLEYAAERENRWWRGGLIAALLLVALSILIAGHHRHERMMMMARGAQMGMGCDGLRMMPYGPPAAPPYWGYGPGPGWSGPQGWRYRQWNGPGPEGPPPPKG